MSKSHATGLYSHYIVSFFDSNVSNITQTLVFTVNNPYFLCSLGNVPTAPLFTYDCKGCIVPTCQVTKKEEPLRNRNQTWKIFNEYWYIEKKWVEKLYWYKYINVRS